MHKWHATLPPVGVDIDAYAGLYLHMPKSKWPDENEDRVVFIFSRLQLIALEHAVIEGGINRIETIRSVLGEKAAQAIRSARAKIAAVLAKEAPIVFSVMELMVLEHVVIEGGIKRMATIRGVLGEAFAHSMTSAYEKINREIESL